MDCPKVLVSSMDVWNTESGSDTFSNLLSGYNPKNVANIYFRSGIPSSMSASRFFFISENAVIKSILNKNVITGQEIPRSVSGDSKNKMDENKATEKKRYSFFSKHRWWIFIFAREILWKIGKWNSSKLDDFINDFQPDLLFCPIESYIHFNRVNEYIINKTKIPLITYMWDDNFSYINCNGVGAKIYRLILRRYVKRLLQKSSKVFVISHKMKQELKDYYGIETEVLTKGALLNKVETERKTPVYPLRMVYTGKLVYGRLFTLQAVADAINRLNHHKMKIEFYIYSGTELSSRELQSLEKKGVFFCGSVSQEEVGKIQKNADILLLVESLKGKHKYDARLSFSTKTVDYLAAGKCIVAVGPSDIATMEYLKDSGTALCASSEEEIMYLFEQCITVNTVIQYGKRAQQLARDHHNLLTIQEKLYREFENLV